MFVCDREHMHTQGEQQAETEGGTDFPQNREPSAKLGPKTLGS